MSNGKKILFVLATALLASCEVSSLPTEGSSSASESSSETTSEKSSVDFSTLTYNEDLIWFPELKVQVGEKQYMKNYLLCFDDSEILIPDTTMLKFEDDYLTALAEGDTYLVYYGNGEYKKVDVHIAPKGTYTRSYNFDDIAEELKGKKCINYGDSLSCDWTVGDEVSIYARRFAAHYDMSECVNRALGGTTSIYPKKNANVWHEYGNSEYAYYDGCDYAYNDLQDGTLAQMDIMFITYGYNDLYFQPKIDDSRDHEECHDDSFSICHSWKGCWRYMINCARAANPNIKIVLMNMIYNEYDLAHNAYTHNPNYTFDKGITYADFRQAVYELGYEMDCKVIDPWEYMQDLFDWYQGRPTKDEDPVAFMKYNYIDNMHPSILGNKHLANWVYKW